MGQKQECGEGDLETRRRSLESVLERRRAERERRETARGPDNAGLGNGLRLSNEFVAAILVGAAIGHVLDRLAGTTPWGLIAFVLLGFAAGVRNVIRASERMAEPGGRGGERGGPADGTGGG